MSGSRWVITPLWLSGAWISFLYSSSVYTWHLFLISSASVRSIPFLSFILHIFERNVPLVSLIFLKRSLVFPILLFSSISLHWSLRKAFLALLAILWNCTFKWEYPFPLCFSLLFFSQLFVRPSQTTILPFCISLPWAWSWSLPPIQYHKPPSKFFKHSMRSNPLTLSLPLYNCNEFKSYMNSLVVFPTFFNLSLNLPIRSSWSVPQSVPGLVFADCIEHLHLWLQRI